jgi:hypothetical protein
MFLNVPDSVLKYSKMFLSMVECLATIVGVGVGAALQPQ